MPEPRSPHNPLWWMTRIKMAVLRWSFRVGLVDQQRVEAEVHHTVTAWLAFLRDMTEEFNRPGAARRWPWNSRNRGGGNGAS